MSLELPQPLAAGASVDTAKFVVLETVTDDKQRFAVNREGLLRLSKLARQLLETASEDEAIPLDNPHCTNDAVACFVAWVNHHSEQGSLLTKVTYPLPSGELGNVFAEWDLKFIETHLVPGGDMKNHRKLYYLASLAVYLGVTILQEMCCAYFAWHIRKATEDSKTAGNPTPTAVVRSWFGLEGDFSDEELKGIVEKFKWCRDVDYNQLEKDSEDAHEMAQQNQAPAAAA